MAATPTKPIAGEPDPGTDPDVQPVGGRGNGGGYSQEFTTERRDRIDAMGKLLTKGNASLANALVDADDGKLPDDADRLLTLVSASRGVEGKALDKYLKLRRKLRPQLDAAYQDYYRHRQRTLRLVDRIVDDAIPGTV